MPSIHLKYFFLVAALMALFANFVACGAQLYQVSLREDISESKLSADASDPTSPAYGVHASKGWKSLPIHFRVGQSLNEGQLAGLMSAINKWEMAVGRKLFSFDGTHTGTDGDSFKDLYSSLADHINGHYMDNKWEKTGKSKVVLATTIWENDSKDANAIDTADIRFNGEYYVIGDSLKLRTDGKKEVVDMETLALHELGHLLGLSHIESKVDTDSIMTASLFIGEGLANRRLSEGDIDRIQKIYGCQGSACDKKALMATFSTLETNTKPTESKKSEVAR